MESNYVKSAPLEEAKMLSVAEPKTATLTDSTNTFTRTNLEYAKKETEMENNTALISGISPTTASALEALESNTARMADEAEPYELLSEREWDEIDEICKCKEESEKDQMKKKYFNWLLVLIALLILYLLLGRKSTK